MQRRRHVEREIEVLKREPNGVGFVFRVLTFATLTSFALRIEPSAAASMCANLTGLVAAADKGHARPIISGG